MMYPLRTYDGVEFSKKKTGFSVIQVIISLHWLRYQLLRNRISFSFTPSFPHLNPLTRVDFLGSI